MNTIPMEYSGNNWFFNYNYEPSSTDIPVHLKNDNSLVYIEIPYGIKGMLITLNQYNPEKKELKGNYLIRDFGVTDKVIFRITKDCLEGMPAGFHVDMTWTLKKID